MTPTLDQYKKGATTWREKHEGVSILLSHHGVRDDPDFITGRPHPGTWAYYLLVPEQMYPENWDAFKCIRDDSGFEHPGFAWDYIDFRGGITWSSSKPYFDRKTMRQWDCVKVGCDYNHLWNEEAGYPDDFNSVLRDARISVDMLVQAYPAMHLRCPYKGIWAPRLDFYLANNGCMVHKSVASEAKASDHWMPAPEVAI